MGGTGIGELGDGLVVEAGHLLERGEVGVGTVVGRSGAGAAGHSGMWQYHGRLQNRRLGLIGNKPLKGVGQLSLKELVWKEGGLQGQSLRRIGHSPSGTLPRKICFF